MVEGGVNWVDGVDSIGGVEGQGGNGREGSEGLERQEVVVTENSASHEVSGGSQGDGCHGKHHHGLTQHTSVNQGQSLSLVQRGLTLIGREVQSVAPPALLCNKEPARASKAPY